MSGSEARYGSSLEGWLDESGIREEVSAEAIKAVVAARIAAEMKKQGITKTRMAEIMKTSRAQVDRLLSASDSGATLDTLSRAAQAVGRTLLVELT